MATRPHSPLQRALGEMGVRLLVPFAVGALVAIGLVAVILYFSVNTQRDQTIAAQRAVAQRLAAQTESFMSLLSGDLHAVANVVPLTTANDQVLRRTLERTLQNEPAFMEIAVVGRDGTDRARVTWPGAKPSGSVTATSVEFTAAMSRTSYIGPVWPLNNLPVMTMAEPIMTSDGQVAGVVTALIDLTVLAERVGDTSVGTRGYAFVVDSHGVLVYYRDYKFEGMPADLNLSKFKAVADAIADNSESGAARTYDSSLTVSGESTQAYYTPFQVGATNWYVIAEEPSAEAFAQADQFRAAGVALLVMSVISIFVMGIYISLRVARPIRNLRNGAAQLAAGDLSTRISGIRTGDELQALATEFNDMAAKLEAAQGNLSDVARERELQAQTAQRRLKEMSSLLQAGKAITSLDLANVLSNLAREAAGAVGADRAAIFVVDDQRRKLELRGWWDFRGVPQPNLIYEPGEGIEGWVARENKPLFLANAQADQRFVNKWEHATDVAAVMNLPLTNDNLVVGVLQVSTRPGTPAFSRDDQRLLISFADQSAVAIKNAHLYEVERRRAQEMTVVAEINRTISASLDLDNTLNSILAAIRSLIPYDLAEINLWDEAEKVLRTRGRGVSDPRYDDYARITGGVYRLDEGYTGWIARERQPWLAKDMATDKRSALHALLPADRFPIRSGCGVPLLASDRLVGTLELVSFAPDVFNEAHLETLQTIAAQSAVAIQNAQLFAETRRRVDESAALFRISTIAASALSPDELLHQLMAEIGRLTQAELGVVLLYNANTRWLEPLEKASFGELPSAVGDFRIDTTQPQFKYSVFSTRTAFRTDDALADRRILRAYREFVERYQVRALLTAPLVTHDQAIGEVYMAKRTNTPFTDEDQQQLMTAQTLLADAIVNARLSAETQRRLKQLSLLGEIGRVISAALHENEVLDRLYDQINRVIEARTLFVALFDQERDELSFARLYEEGQAIDLPPEQRVQQGGNTLTFYVCRRRQALLLQGDVNAEAAKLGITVRFVGSARAAKVWIGAPMIAGDRVVGALVVQDLANEFAYDQNDLNVLQSIANQTGIALSNARLYQVTDLRLGERVEELTALSAISRELNSTLEPQRIFDVVLGAASKLTGATHGFISLLDPETQLLHMRASRGYLPAESAQLSQHAVALGHGITGRAAQLGQPVVIGDVRAQEGYVQTLETTRAEIAVPIRYAQSVAGVLNLESPQLNAFTDEHCHFLEALAEQAAIAIGNAQRLEDQMERGELLRRKAEQLTNLFEISQAFRTDQPLDLVLDDVAHAIQETVGFEVVVVNFIEGDPPQLRSVAAAGVPLVQFEEMKRARQALPLLDVIMQDRFRISHSYYVPMEQAEATGDMLTFHVSGSDPAEPRRPGYWHADDMLFTPLIGSGDRILGSLSVDQPANGRIPNRAAIEALELFANQAAIAIENSRLYADLQQRLDNLTLFNEVGRSISAKLDLDSLLSTVLDASMELVGCSHATIFLRDPVDGKYIARKTVGFDLEQISRIRFSANEGLVGAVIADPRGLIVPDAPQDPRFVVMGPSDIRSVLLVPLSVAGQLIGVLSTDKPVPNAFTNTDLVVLSTLADQAAVAIDNARLFEESQRRLREQSLLYETGQAISATLEYKQVLDTLTHQVVRATNAQFVIIQEWDRASGRLVTTHKEFMSTDGLNVDEVSTTAFTPVDYLKVAHFLRDRRNISLRLADDDLDPLLKERMRHVGLLWTIEVPIVARDEVLGVVRLGDGRFDRILADSEVQLVETLVNQAAVAMSNSKLYDQIVRFSQELEERVEARTRELALANADLMHERDRVEVLFRITSELSSSLDLDRVLNRALELLVTAIGAPYGALLLIDQQSDMLLLRARLGPGGSLPPGGKATIFRRGEGLAGWAVTHRQPIIVSDVQVDERWVPVGDAVQTFRSAMAVPLQMGEDILGAVLLMHPQPAFFSETQLLLVTAVGNQVATAINNAELYRYIREQAELLGGMLRAQQIESSKSQAILESVADGVLVSDASGSVILFNAAAERILSVKRDEALGRSIEDMQGLYSAAGINWVTQVREWSKSSDVRRTTPVLSQRIEFREERRYVNVTIAPVTMNEEYLGSVSVFRDITREVEADRAKTDFVSTVSHELRTPMTSIKGYADLLLMGAAGPVNEPQQRFLSVIKSNADRLSILVNDLLDISRIESGRVKLDIRPLSIESVIEQVATSLRGRIEEKRLTLRISLPEDELPRVHGDRDRVIQILTNLVSNAYQYTPPGGSILVNAHRVGTMIQIDVTDTGIGIAPEHQPKVFERFFRVDDPNVQEFPGTGLGLAIVKSLVEMHEGTIWLESQVDVGTTFSFTLRAVLDEAPAEAPQKIETAPLVSAEPAASVSAPTGEEEKPIVEQANGQLHILVVEDDRDIAELISHSLTGSGYSVSVANRAKDAIERVREHRPDLITLDIYLPDADGFEVLQHLKTDRATADIPVVIVSVMPDQREGLRLGAVDYLTKPIDQSRLVSSINRVLHGPGKVLVVDDDRDTRDLLQAALETRGFVVVLTSSGKRATMLARVESPDLILLDLKLPGMDGYEVLQRLKSSPETADIPVMVITGSLTDEDVKKKKVLSLGAARFFTKPFAVDDLVSEIDTLVTQA